jgi:hypothetical protein
MRCDAIKRAVMGAGVIRVARGAEAVGGRRSLSVYIDGAQVGKIARNRSAEFPTPAGPHVVYVRLDWCSSLPVSVELGEGQCLELAVTVQESERRGLRNVVAPAGKTFELFLRPVPRKA